MNVTLISFVGNSDPISNKYDGPLLHIVRHYRPAKLYLIWTEDIKTTSKNIFITEALRNIGFQGEVNDFDLVTNNDPSNFFSFRINEIVNRVTSENPESSIIANVSSGTPQMIAALCNDLISNGRNIKAIQVKHPEPRKKIVPISIEDIHEAIATNNNSIGAINNNRCGETNIYSFRIARQKQILKEAILSFNYSEAKNIISRDRFLESDKQLQWLVKAAADCSDLHSIDEKKLLDEFNLFRVGGHGKLDALIIKYYLSWDLLLHRQDYLSVILRATPLTFELAKLVLMLRVKPLHPQFKLWARLDNFKYETTQSQTKEFLIEMGIPTVIIDDLVRYNKDYFYTNFFIVLIDFYRQNPKYGIVYETVNHLDSIVKLSRTRNDLAHSIDVEKINLEKDHDLAKVALEIHANIKLLIDSLIPNPDGKIEFRFFDKINEAILSRLKSLKER